MRRVTFDIEKDAQDKNDLVMTQAPVLAITSPEYPPKTITLAKDVTFFGLEFWSPNDNEFKTEFLPTNEIPPMVRVTLGIGHVANDPTVPLEIISRVVGNARASALKTKRPYSSPRRGIALMLVMVVIFALHGDHRGVRLFDEGGDAAGPGDGL